MEKYDVVIAGGAVTGASIAWWLAGMAPALSILVVEPDPTYARSATALSVASVRSQFSNPVNVEISRFGVDFIRNFGERVGPEGEVPSLGLKENGYLFLTASESGRAVMQELAVMQRSLGASTEILGPAELAARWPWMKVDDLVAGSFGPRDEGWFDNMGLLHGFRNAGRARGVEYRKGRVAGMNLKGGRVESINLESGETICCGSFVNAAGTASGTLCAKAGLALPVEPRKRTVFVIDAPNARHPEAPLIIDHFGIYLRPEHGQWITATVPAEDGPCDPDDWEPDHAQFEELIWPRLYERSEGFDAVKVARLWVGHYDYNRLDQNAVLGLWPGTENFYIASGFSGHGLQQAPAVGRGMAELILTGAWQTLDLSPLGPERIIAGRPFLEKAVV
ncbi:FAD-binding oxidoreductase [Frigidibacter sp. RF13]|uniref:NAD(P)/FAD-dependent oxidoreductase n=1 Tax=Frigidibacter sp. RF13 TaxID=2997340 RepID=UPI00226EDEBD|nr:FAD-binding oxidoreductase [Frigidibacter sp. RF13]MCY1125651.1 FAD-binding oxidoreductase [Frigidibacter sp. RF13]